MSATAIPSFRKSQESWDASILPGEANPIAPLLDLAILQTNVQGAYVYRYTGISAEATVAAFAGPEPENPGRSLPRDLMSLHWNRRTPVVLRSQAASDWRFSRFPELRAGRFDGLVSVPLLENSEGVGLANFCLKGGAPLSAGAVTFLINLSLPLGTLLAASALRGQLRRAQQHLADRKVVERAKGLLQARFGWTEEETYIRLRRLSRRSRTPLREIAGLIVESGPEPLWEALNR